MPRCSAPVFDAIVVATTALATAFGQEGASDAAPRKDPAPRAAPTSSTAALTLDPKPEKAKGLVVVAGGDVNFGRECGQAILANPSYDPFQFVEPLFRDADLTFVNLESQLSDQKGETQSPKNRLIFTGPPGGADVLARAG